MGEEAQRRGRKKAQPVIKYKVETCWPMSPGRWRTVVEWDGGREAQRSITALRSMRYPVRLTVQFLDGASCMPGQVPFSMGEFTVLERDKFDHVRFVRYRTNLSHFLPEWVYGEEVRVAVHG